MRRALGIVGVALAVLCTVAGLVALLLPYDASTGVPGFTETVEVRCQPPLVDAVSKEDAADGWFLFQEDGGVVFTDDVDDTGKGGGTITTGGSLCYPDSVQRGAIGAGLVTVGVMGLLGWQVVRARRRGRGADAPELSSEG